VTNHISKARQIGGSPDSSLSLRERGPDHLPLPLLQEKGRAIFLFAACWIIALFGCRDSGPVGGTIRTSGGTGDARSNAELFKTTFDSLDRLPDFVDVDKFVNPESAERIAIQLGNWVRTGEPTYAWEPTPDEAILDQIVDWLNQWVIRRSGEVESTADPLISKLPKNLQELPAMKRLSRFAFSKFDGRVLEETLWFRRTSEQIKSKLPPEQQSDDLALAQALFDWTIRNIQLDAADPAKTRLHFPWQILFYGHGTAEERAWAFICLARQQRLDVVMLAARGSSGVLQPWLPALFHQDQLYLFDTNLGLAIPGPPGEPPRQPLLRRPATLAEVAADDGLLRQLDLDAEHPYPRKAADATEVVALIEASPSSLSKRMRLVQSQLAGERRMVLTVDPSALGERLKVIPQVKGVQLWTLPFETLARQAELDQPTREALQRELLGVIANPVLWKARALHLHGNVSGKEGASFLYLQSRPPTAIIKGSGLPERQQELTLEAKQTASYWLGLVSYDGGDYRQAIDFFSRRTLEAWPAGKWSTGARYNLARTSEAEYRRKIATATEQQAQASEKQAEADEKTADSEQHKSAGREGVSRQLQREATRLRDDAQTLIKEAQQLTDEASEYLLRATQWLEVTGDSPQRHGDLLRARWLRAEKAASGG